MIKPLGKLLIGTGVAPGAEPTGVRRMNAVKGSSVVAAHMERFTNSHKQLMTSLDSLIEDLKPKCCDDPKVQTPCGECEPEKEGRATQKNLGSPKQL